MVGARSIVKPMVALNALPPSLQPILDPILESGGGNNNARGAVRSQSCATQGRQGRKPPPRSYTPRPGAAFTPSTKMNQLQTDIVNNPEAVDYNTMIVCALHRAPSAMVNCNVCSTTHAFYQCPTLNDMDEEAQKAYFRARALEKRQAKKTQYQVDQVYAEDDQDDQDDDDEYAGASDDMSNWTQEDWAGFQNGSFAPYSRPNFR